jgi:hypothetical protein
VTVDLFKYLLGAAYLLSLLFLVREAVRLKNGPDIPSRRRQARQRILLLVSIALLVLVPIGENAIFGPFPSRLPVDAPLYWPMYFVAMPFLIISAANFAVTLALLVAFVAGRLGEEEAGQRAPFAERIARPGSIAILACITGAILALKWTLDPAPHFVNPHFVSSRYEWPSGCVVRRYIEDEGIPGACADPKYYIGDGYKYGFPQQGRGRATYYRVNNDAVDIGCEVFRDRCVANFIVKDVFVSK